jgi:hypothetical protein
VFLWFIGTAIVTVGVVFRDPRFDYRLLVVGAVLPLGDGVFGGARVLHTLAFSVVLLVVIMLATSGRRPVRKLLLGLPIGMILHLVFDGAWGDTEVFWWPAFGWSFGDAPLPEFDRGWWTPLLEVVGFALCAWLLRRNRFGDPARRRQFLCDGHLDAVPDRLG